MFGLGPAELLILVVVSAIVVLPYWKIFQKAGFPGALALTQIVPPLGLLVLFYVAFAEWPVHRDYSA